MLQMLTCSRFNCRHNKDGVCRALTVNQEEKTIEMWNVTYNECKTYEESEEYKCQLKKQ